MGDMGELGEDEAAAMHAEVGARMHGIKASRPHILSATTALKQRKRLARKVCGLLTKIR